MVVLVDLLAVADGECLPSPGRHAVARVFFVDDVLEVFSNVLGSIGIRVPCYSSP